ncbi:hypothetical protein DFQ26_009495 [Actinomortierella ambigua]|nr:hypothetical protein DFQ26_009495 [Actinomortierella ambigua]
MLRRSIQHGLIAKSGYRATSVTAMQAWGRTARTTSVSYSTAAHASSTNKRSTATWSIVASAAAVTTAAAVIATQVHLQPEDWQRTMAALGLSKNMVYNDSNKGTEPLPQPSFWHKLPLPYFLIGDRPKAEPLPLDSDLTVTSWKQEEQMHLINAPGVLIWGSNKNGLVDPSGKTPAMVQIPQRLKTFEGQVLRDLKLGDDVAAAVDGDGNLYQWGTGFQKEKHNPEVTLKNRNLKQVAIGESRLFALGQDGSRVYVVPKIRPATGPTNAAVDFVPEKRGSGSGFWKYVGLGSDANRDHDPMTQLPVRDVLQPGETIQSIAAGKNHVLMVTSMGRVLGSEDGLSVAVVGAGEFKQTKIVEVACGDVHSLARDDRGRCWAWGVNGFGQLAQGAYSHAHLRLPTPTLVPGIEGSAEGAASHSQDWVGCTRVAAGSNTSYFVVRGKRGFKVLSAGMGQWGQLGDGTFTHIQGAPVTIPQLSNLAEYKEDINKTVPIGIHDLVSGSTHVFAVLDNDVNIAVKDDTSKPIFYGRDVLSWGQNTYFQLLTGKRSNRAEPTHALPVDSDLLRSADVAIAAIANGDAPVVSDTKKLEDPRNRLQLSPMRRIDGNGDRQSSENGVEKKNGKSGGGKEGNLERISGRWAEEKLAAGHSVTAVYCQEIDASAY